MVKSEWDKLLTGIAKWEREHAAFSEVNQMGQVKSSQPLSFVFNHPNWLGSQSRMGCVAN